MPATTGTLRSPQFVGPRLLLGIAHLFGIIEREGEMNPAVRAVTNPGAFRCKADLITFLSVPDRFGVPVHPFCAASEEFLREPLSVFSHRQRPLMTPISLMAKNFNSKFGACSVIWVRFLAMSIEADTPAGQAA